MLGVTACRHAVFCSTAQRTATVWTGSCSRSRPAGCGKAALPSAELVSDGHWISGTMKGALFAGRGVTLHTQCRACS